MTETRNKINILRVRSRLGTSHWSAPRTYGDDGWMLDSADAAKRIIVSYHGVLDGHEWLHASISLRWGQGVPSYADMQQLHRAVWGEGGWSYEVHAPASDHVNIHPRALHLWGRLDGQPALPDFAPGGSI